MSFGLLHGIANILNFLLFVFIVVKFAGPPIAKNVEDRRQAALDAIKEATESNRKAIAVLADTQARLANVDGELATMLEDARKIGLSQAASMEESTRADVERLHIAAKAEIERQRQAAVQEVRSLLMRQAFERAALELQQSMTVERQRELVNGVVQKVGDGSLVLM
jgi:F-type H+-transporting ATPase subunit b